MKMPTIFFGASSYVLPIIEFLHADYNLKLVVTTEMQPTDAVLKYCKENTIPFISVKSLDDQAIRHKLSAINPSFAVLADFRLFVPKKVMEIFPKGIINIHPSLLPKYRGQTPGLSAILHGETTTGVSIMLLDQELDHGPILAQKESPIYDSDTSASLYPRLFEEGTTLLKQVLPEYLEGILIPTPQDHSQATYSESDLTRESGFIDLDRIVISNGRTEGRLPASEAPNQKSVQGEAQTGAEMRDLQGDEISPLRQPQGRNDKKYLTQNQLSNMIRAYYPWPGVWTLLRKKATEGQAAKDVRVKLLPEEKVQVEGKKPVSYKDFINGYPEGKELLEKLHLFP